MSLSATSTLPALSILTRMLRAARVLRNDVQVSEPRRACDARRLKERTDCAGTEERAVDHGGRGKATLDPDPTPGAVRTEPVDAT